MVHKLLKMFTSPNILICFIVGYIFVLAGLFKWLGLLDFIGLPLPWPEGTVLIVGFVELICGSLILFRLHLQWAVPPLVVIMIGALTLTKIPIAFNEGISWMLFESRLDLIMLSLLLYLWLKTKPTEDDAVSSP